MGYLVRIILTDKGKMKDPQEYDKASDCWRLSKFLHDRDPMLRQKAADTIIELFKRMRSLEERTRALRYMDISLDNLDDFRRFPPETYFHLMVIASFNENGRVRERAITLLRETHRPEAIRYYLLRAADWVEQVRDAARESLRPFLTPAFRIDFIRLRPEVEWLLAVKRTDLSGLFAEIIDLITSERLTRETTQLLIVEERSRLFLFRHYLKKEGLTETLLSLILQDKSFLIRAEVFPCMQALPGDQQRAILSKLLHDRSARIRLHALYALKPYKESFREAIVALLSDTSASVREWARLYLGLENIASSAYYRDKVRAEDPSPGDIMGLAETGSAEDIPVFEKFIHHPSSQLACLIALSRLNNERAVGYALDLLTGPTNKTGRKCVEILAKSPDPVTLERVREMYRAGTAREKRLILTLYNRIGGWMVIADILLALMDVVREIRTMAWGYLYEWRQAAVHRFAAPSSKEAARAQEAYEWVSNAHVAMSYEQEKLWKELPFFLRN